MHYVRTCPLKPALLKVKSIGHGFNVQSFSQKVGVLGVKQDGSEQLGSHHRAARIFTLLLDAKDISQHNSAQGLNGSLEIGMSFGRGWS